MAQSWGTVANPVPKAQSLKPKALIIDSEKELENMARRIKSAGTVIAVLIVLLACVGAAFGQDDSPVETKTAGLWDSIFRPLFKTIVFGGVGLFFLLVSYKVIDLVTPFSMNKEIAEDDNTAVGILAAGMMIAIAIILHAAISVA